MTILYFILAIGILILVHELGHFILARRNGIRVEQFSIGFGPPIIKTKKGETEYKIAPIPLGGYVKMTGEDPSEAASRDEKSFANKSVWARMKVVGAGPVMNILFALVFMPLAFFVGRMEPKFLYEKPVVIGVKDNSEAQKIGMAKGDEILTISGKKVEMWKDALIAIEAEKDDTVNISYSHEGQIAEAEIAKDKPAGFEPSLFYGNETFVDEVMGGGAAQIAGIQKGDKIVSINGLALDGFINGWIEMTKVVNDSKGEPVEVAVERKGEILKFSVRPKLQKDIYLIGIKRELNPDSFPMIKKSYAVGESIKKGAEEFYIMMGLTLDVIKRLFTAELSYKSLGGPVQIAKISGVAAKQGLGDFIYFLAFMSIQLGILNLLPIPVLDGGHILFCGIEAVLRKPLPVRVRIYATYAGLTFILFILTLVTFNDIDSIWGIKDKFQGIFK